MLILEGRFGRGGATRFGLMEGRCGTNLLGSAVLGVEEGGVSVLGVEEGGVSFLGVIEGGVSVLVAAAAAGILESLLAAAVSVDFACFSFLLGGLYGNSSSLERFSVGGAWFLVGGVREPSDFPDKSEDEVDL